MFHAAVIEKTLVVSTSLLSGLHMINKGFSFGLLLWSMGIKKVKYLACDKISAERV